MVDIRTDSIRRNDVTFVTAVVRNDRSTPQIVTLRNRLDGPVWPPRFGNVTAPEWDGQTWEKRVEPDQRVGLGYASPAPARPDGESLEIVSVSRAVETDRGSPTAVLASLEAWAPERTELER